MIKKINTHKILLFFASYGIVQVLAQDLGIKTGKKQRDLVRFMPVQIILLYSVAYAVSNDLLLSFLSTLLYYYLKYIYSQNKTSIVCFEDV